MNKRHLFAGALSASLVLSALPGSALAQEDDTVVTPEGLEWTLTTLAGAAVDEGVEVTLFLSGGEVVGNAGCNSYFGSYELDGESLTFPNPFGVTRKLCEEPLMSVEEAYLPLLQATASWSIDAAGVLSLADADGVVGLVYSEAPVDVTASEVNALVSTLEDLQTQIDEASAEVAALAESAASINVSRFDRRLGATEEGLAALQDQVGDVNSVNLRRRVGALEETVERLDRTIDRFRDRIVELERIGREQNRRLNEQQRRISELEDAVNVPTPASE